LTKLFTRKNISAIINLMSKVKSSSAKTAAGKSAKASADKEKNFPAELIKYLEDKKASAKILSHKTVYTAIDAANTLKRDVSDIAKALLVKADDQYYIICLSANQNLDLEKIKKAVEKKTGKKVRTVRIPSEQMMRDILELRDQGVSAFGSFYDLPVIAEKKLAGLSRMVFPSGSFNHSVEMRANDFLKLENAVLASFGINKKVKLIKVRPHSPLKVKKSANKTMATKKKATKKVAKKKVAAKKKK
jgi:prolyl-tRNA editing enzyme YbaK/EbsC (Cys-tRNA(Pro) deacylase)